MIGSKRTAAKLADKFTESLSFIGDVVKAIEFVRPLEGKPSSVGPDEGQRPADFYAAAEQIAPQVAGINRWRPPSGVVTVELQSGFLCGETA